MKLILAFTSLAVLTFVAAAIAVSATVGTFGQSADAQAAGGPVILMGIDAEDCGPGGHGPITVYEDVVESILANVTNGGDGILVIGGGKAASGPTAFWNAIGADIGETITYVDDAANITAQSFAGFEMIAVVSTEFDTCNGMTQDENTALAGRIADIAAFVNGGGGLLGFSQGGMTNPYDYIGGLGSFTVETGLGYDEIEPTAAGAAVGITDDLDLCCWHDVYLTFPSFLDVLAIQDDAGEDHFGEAAAIGGAQVVILPEGPFGDPTCSDGIDNDADTLIDDDDPDCAPPVTPTPEPTPTPVPVVAAEVEAPEALPDTGGTPGSTTDATWLAVIAGAALMAVTALAGGAWLAMERRRAR